MDVTLPNGRVIKGVPDGTPKDVIMQKAISSGLATRADFGLQPQVQPSANNPDVPGIEGEPNLSQATPTNRTIGENIVGLGETALTLGSGATGGALGFMSGSIEGAARNLVGDMTQQEAMQLAQERAKGLTYEPRGEAGKSFVGDVGEALSSLPPVMGGEVGAGLRSIKLPQSKNKTLNAINESAPDQVKKSFTKKLGEDRFEPHIFGMVKEARKQGFDDSVTTLIANAGPETRRRMLRQVATVEKGKGDARAKALTRTADEAGDALVKQINFVKSNNNQAGQQLNRVAGGLKGKAVDVSEPINKFFTDMDGLGVSFNKKGKPIFEGSQIEGVAPAESLINKIALRIKRNPNPDALEAHQFKKFIDENVSFGKLAEGLSGKTERVVKKLRSGVNDSISSEYGAYKEANKRFSDTITALDDLQDVAGRKLDFSGPHADKAAGTLLRSQTNNTKGRANLLTAIKNLEDTAKKYGGSFDDDILSLSIFADELDAVFGSGARTSLRGEVGKAGVDTAIDVSQMTIPGALAVGAKAGARRIRGINEANQLKSIKKLLKAK